MHNSADDFRRYIGLAASARHAGPICMGTPASVRSTHASAISARAADVAPGHRRRPLCSVTALGSNSKINLGLFSGGNHIPPRPRAVNAFSYSRMQCSRITGTRPCVAIRKYIGPKHTFISCYVFLTQDRVIQQERLVSVGTLVDRSLHLPRQARSADSQIRGALLQHHRHIADFYVLDDISYHNSGTRCVSRRRMCGRVCMRSRLRSALASWVRRSVSLDSKLSPDMAA